MKKLNKENIGQVFFELDVGEKLIARLVSMCACKGLFGPEKTVPANESFDRVVLALMKYGKELLETSKSISVQNEK